MVREGVRVQLALGFRWDVFWLLLYIVSVSFVVSGVLVKSRRNRK